MSEVRVYHLGCQCEVLAPGVEQSRLAELAFPYIQRSDLTGLDGLSYIRVERDERVTIVGKPSGNGKTRQFTLEPETQATYRSLRSAEPWEEASRKYTEILEQHVSSYGRSRSSDKFFTLNVRAPHWIDLTVTNPSCKIALRHGDRFSHVHPERRKLAEIPVDAEFKKALIKAGFTTQEHLQLYYFETMGYTQAHQDDKGWLVIDLKEGLVAGWASGKRVANIQRMDKALTVVELPSVNR